MIFMNFMRPLFLGYIVLFMTSLTLDLLLITSYRVVPPQSPYEVQFSLMEIGLLSCNAT
jgi:hypothetical protein